MTKGYKALMGLLFLSFGIAVAMPGDWDLQIPAEPTAEELQVVEIRARRLQAYMVMQAADPQRHRGQIAALLAMAAGVSLLGHAIVEVALDFREGRHKRLRLL